MLSSSRSFALRRLAAPPPRPRFGLHDQRVALSLRGRRSFTTPAIESLSEGFLDLALALPIPPSLPPYSATIVIVTVVSRLLFTVPFSLWARKREWKVEEEVMPRLRALGPQLSQSVADEMAALGVSGTKEELAKAHKTRVQKLLKEKRNQLFKEHGCSPTLTMLIPIATQLPLFALTSLVFAHACALPTPLDSEAFLSLTSLSHPDPIAGLPIALGLISLANVESTRLPQTAEQRERAAKVEAWAAERKARGEVVIRPRKNLEFALRALCVGRIVWASMIPGGVVIYWVASASFGLLQTWVMEWLGKRRRRSHPLPEPFKAAAPRPVFALKSSRAK